MGKGTEHDENLSDLANKSCITEDSKRSFTFDENEPLDSKIVKLLELIPPSIRNCKHYSEIIDTKISEVLSKTITIEEYEDYFKKLHASQLADKIPEVNVPAPMNRKFKIKETNILGSFPGICQNKGILEKFVKILEHYGDKDIPKCFEKLIEQMQLNYLILNLNEVMKGYELLVFNYGDIVERSFGVHSYSNSIMDHIQNGVIPYEILDKLLGSQVPLIYDGYLFIRIETFVGTKKGFYPLKHSNETINGICDIIAHATSYSSKKMRKIKSQLYVEIFPNLYLSPKPIQKESCTFNFQSEIIRRNLATEVEKRMKALNMLKKAYEEGLLSSLNVEDVLEFLHRKKENQITCLMEEINFNTDCEVDDKDIEMFLDHMKKLEEKTRDEEFAESIDNKEIDNLVDMQSTSSEEMDKAKNAIERKAMEFSVFPIAMNYIRKRRIVIPDTISCDKFVNILNNF
ncbi:hypothetical protein TNCT_704481 [Trichonephila clavata]|uniref:Uncharacterized protein n=1 Tax=Trichonephila clavata TaxID=2740835 RepID=A0A8X6GBL7_TRICU|nr:hypothetical protein TNCT_704481 [Trichonephila clavata]